MPTGRAQSLPAQHRPERTPRPPPPAAAVPQEGSDATARGARQRCKQAAKSLEAPSSKRRAEWWTAGATRERTEGALRLKESAVGNRPPLPSPPTVIGHIKSLVPGPEGPQSLTLLFESVMYIIRQEEKH